MLMAPSCCLGASQCSVPCSDPHPPPAAAATCWHTHHPSAAALHACGESRGVQGPSMAPEPGKGFHGQRALSLPLCSPASLHNAPILEHQDLVCTHHGREPAGKGRVLFWLGGGHTAQGAAVTGLSLLGRRTGLQVPQHFPDQPFPLSLPMCNNNGGAVGADLGQGGLDVPLGLRVKCRCGLRKGQGVRKGYRQLLGQGLLQSRAGLGWGLLLLPHLAG